MLSSHVASLVHRSLGSGVYGAKPCRGMPRASVARKRPFTLRKYCSPVEPSVAYKVSYDMRQPVKEKQWPRTRQEELEQLALEVHPEATTKKADPNTFSFGVRVNERVSPSLPDRTIESVQGLLKPPPIMQRTDPFVLKQHQKRKLLREDLFALLRSDTGSLTIDTINDTYDKLRVLDLEDIQDGFEPQYFTKERLSSESSGQLNLASSAVQPPHITAKRILSGKVGDQEWTLASTALRRKFISDILTNYKEHLEMPSSRQIAPPKRGVVEYLNTLTLPRLYGLVAQTALVLPWAAMRQTLKFFEINQPTSFWAAEKQTTWQMVQKGLADIDSKGQSEIRVLEEVREATLKEYGRASYNLYRVSSLPIRSLIYFLKFTTWYPIVLLSKMTKYSAMFAFFCVYGPLDLAYRSWKRIEPWLGRSMIGRSGQTLWRALAPHTWKRYYLGDPLGTLWDHHTGHGEQISSQSRDAFNKVGYTLERVTFGLFHSIRLFGLLLLVLAAGVTASLLIEQDQALLDALQEQTEDYSSAN